MYFHSDSYTYSLVAGVGDSDNGAFSIVGSELRLNISPDFEAKSSYSIRVRSTDEQGLSVEKVKLISITNVNEAPTELSLSANSIEENVPANTIIGDFTTTDPDLVDSHTYSLVTGEGDSDNLAFTIVDNQLRINNSRDFESKSSYSIRVRTTERAGDSFEQILTIDITDLIEEPTLPQISADLLNDTGVSDRDGLTAEAQIVGTIGTLASFKAKPIQMAILFLRFTMR